jgi:hypothetical protein
MDDDHTQETCEGMGPVEPAEVLELPENVDAADAIRAASIAALDLEER